MIRLSCFDPSRIARVPESRILFRESVTKVIIYHESVCRDILAKVLQSYAKERAKVKVHLEPVGPISLAHMHPISNNLS